MKNYLIFINNFFVIITFVLVVSIGMCASYIIYEEAKDTNPVAVWAEFWKKYYISMGRVYVVIGTAVYKLMKDIFNPANFKIKIF